MVELALLDLMADRDVWPDMVLGASLGEFAAAVASGVLDAPTALRLACDLGAVVARDLPGGMLAVLAPVGLYEEEPALHGREPRSPGSSSAAHFRRERPDRGAGGHGGAGARRPQGAHLTSGVAVRHAFPLAPDGSPPRAPARAGRGRGLRPRSAPAGLVERHGRSRGGAWTRRFLERGAPPDPLRGRGWAAVRVRPGPHHLTMDLSPSGGYLAQPPHRACSRGAPARSRSR